MNNQRWLPEAIPFTSTQHLISPSCKTLMLIFMKKSRSVDELNGVEISKTPTTGNKGMPP